MELLKLDIYGIFGMSRQSRPKRKIFCAAMLLLMCLENVLTALVSLYSF